MAKKKLYEKLSSEVTDITPEKAKTILTKSRFNRPVSDHKVARYADLMKAGKWMLTHQGIAIDWDGFLIDGQHRLQAIIQSNVTVTTTIYYGLAPTAFESIDVPEAARRAPDLIGMAIGSTKGWTRAQDSIFTSRLNAIMLITTNRRPFNNRQEVITWANCYMDGLEWSMKALPGTVGYQQAMVAGALAYAHMVEPDLTERLVIHLKDGLFSDKKDPAKTLYDFIAKKLGRSVVGADRRPMGVEVLKALYAMDHDLQLRKSENLESEALTYFRAKHKARTSSIL